MAQKGPFKQRYKKNSVPEKKNNSDRWLLTYADMITLLMAFFIVMYALSKVEVVKFNALAESLSNAFNMPGVQLQDGQGGHSLSPTEATLAPPPGTGLSAKKSNRRDPFIEKAQSTLQSEIKTGRVRINTEARGIVLALAGDTYFRSGSAEASENTIDLLVKVAELIKPLPNPISIEGHSDNTPTGEDPRYHSNLALSAARAITITETLELLDIPLVRMSATGFGDTKPVRPNTTPEGRAFNRRVEILIRFDTE